MFYTSEQEVIALVQAFHCRALSPTKWDHAALLTVTLYYGLKFPYSVAYDLIREGIRWVTVETDLSHETQKHQETSIHYWLQTVTEFAIKYQNIEDLSALANILIATHKESERPVNYYAREPALKKDATQMVTGRRSDSATVDLSLIVQTLATAV